MTQLLKFFIPSWRFFNTLSNCQTLQYRYTQPQSNKWTEWDNFTHFNKTHPLKNLFFNQQNNSLLAIENYLINGLIYKKISIDEFKEHFNHYIGCNLKHSLKVLEVEIRIIDVSYGKNFDIITTLNWQIHDH